MTGERPRILCFGEMLMRLSPPDRTELFQTPSLDVNFGGAEANVAAGLARLGAASAMASVVPDDAIGAAVVEQARRAGVDTSRIRRAPGRLGLWFLATGIGHRAGRVIYDRADSVFARATARDFDWPALLAGFDWLHLSGITPALGPAGTALALAAVEAACEAGVRVSFDGNYRARLWEAWDSRPAETLRTLVGQADLLFGNERDIELLLGEPAGADSRAAALACFGAFPRLRWITATERRVIHADHHQLAARLDTPDERLRTEEVTIAGIVDRIGGGDAFAAGVLSTIDADPALALRRGFAAAVLKHYTPGDASLATMAQVDEFDGSGRDVQR